MSCYICNKSVSRVKQHLKTQHKCLNTYFEPDTLETYAILLNTLPSSKIILRSHDIIDKYLSGKCDLPSELYSEMQRCFNLYKQKKGVKPLLRVGCEENKKTRQDKKFPAKEQK